MDLFSLSYRIQQDRYHVAPEAVAEAIIRWYRWHRGSGVSADGEAKERASGSNGVGGTTRPSLGSRSDRRA